MYLKIVYSNHQHSEKNIYGKGRMFANHVSNKSLISKMYKEFIQLNSKNQITHNGKTQKTILLKTAKTK